MFRRILASSLVVFCVAFAATASPGISTNVLGLKLSFDDCKSRVATAMRSRGYDDLYDFGNGWTAVNARYAASVGCIQGRDGSVVSVVVASNDSTTKEEADRLLDLVRNGGSGGGGDDNLRGRELDWSDSLSSLRMREKTGRFTFTCPRDGSAHQVWGTDVYTDDSSVCTAAVHAGLISMARGGSVTIETLPGRSSYDGTLRNGVSTSSYGAWGYSFELVGGSRGGGGGPRDTGVRPIAWNDTARAWSGQIGKHLRFRCPPGGSADATVWGSSPYTDDSAVCVAAVHAGLISFSRGGDVTIEMRGARTSFSGSTRRGVTSRDYGSWGASYVFLTVDE